MHVRDHNSVCSAKNCRLSGTYYREIKIHVYRRGKRRSDSSWKFLRIENKQIETVPNDLYG